MSRIDGGVSTYNLYIDFWDNVKAGCMQSPRDNLIRTVLPSLTFVMLLSVVLRMQIWGLLDSKMAISDDLVTLSKITYQSLSIFDIFTAKLIKFSNLGFNFL